MVFVAFFVILISVGLGILISAGAIMALTAFLHDTWWEAIPALDFNQAFLMGVFFGCFQLATTLTESKASLSAAIGQGVLALIAVPFLLPWIVGELNNSLIPVMPDITYGTSLVFTLIGLGFAIPEAVLSRFLEGINES